MHSLLESKDDFYRTQANALSSKIFQKHGIDIDDWTNYSVYNYFYNKNDKRGGVDIATTATPYLELLRQIRNRISHLRILGDIDEAHRNMPICLHEWIKELLNLIRRQQPKIIFQ